MWSRELKVPTAGTRGSVLALASVVGLIAIDLTVVSLRLRIDYFDSYQNLLSARAILDRNALDYSIYRGMLLQLELGLRPALLGAALLSMNVLIINNAPLAKEDIPGSTGAPGSRTGSPTSRLPAPWREPPPAAILCYRCGWRSSRRSRSSPPWTGLRVEPHMSVTSLMRGGVAYPDQSLTALLVRVIAFQAARSFSPPGQ